MWLKSDVLFFFSGIHEPGRRDDVKCFFMHFYIFLTLSVRRNFSNCNHVAGAAIGFVSPFRSVYQKGSALHSILPSSGWKAPRWTGVQSIYDPKPDVGSRRSGSRRGSRTSNMAEVDEERHPSAAHAFSLGEMGGQQANGCPFFTVHVECRKHVFTLRLCSVKKL